MAREVPVEMTVVTAGPAEMAVAVAEASCSIRPATK